MMTWVSTGVYWRAAGYLFITQSLHRLPSVSKLDGFVQRAVHKLISEDGALWMRCIARVRAPVQGVGWMGICRLCWVAEVIPGVRITLQSCETSRDHRMDCTASKHPKCLYTVTVGELMDCKLTSDLHSCLFLWQEWLSSDIQPVWNRSGLEIWGLSMPVSNPLCGQRETKDFSSRYHTSVNGCAPAVLVWGQLLAMDCWYLNPPRGRSWKQNLADRTSPTCARAEGKQACLILNYFCIKSLLSRHLLFPIA